MAGMLQNHVEVARLYHDCSDQKRALNEVVRFRNQLKGVLEK